MLRIVGACSRVKGLESQGSGGDSQSRTGTVCKDRRILSPLRLPVPPYPRDEHGAGEGDRTLTASLEGWNSTIELHPHR